MTIGRILGNNQDKGSGFALATSHSGSTRIVLTANHVVDNQEASSIQFATQSGRRIPVERVERADDLDTAVLYLGEDVPGGLVAGQAVEGAGWKVETQPRGNDPMLKGIIDATRWRVVKKSGREIYVLQLRVHEHLDDYKGYSGSAVLLDSPSGGVVGILIEQLLSRLSGTIGQSKPATNVLYALPIQDVLDRFDLHDVPRITTVDLQMHTVSSSPSSLPLVRNIPHPRNPFFTGRDEVLTRLATALKPGTVPVQTQAICGLAGVGKTQIALEYAYRFQEDYQAVLWAQADTREVLISAFISAARLLDLPEKDAQDQNVVVAAFLQWMKTHSKWLLILDNVEDLGMLSEFIPPAHDGHIILTTRAQSMGRLAQRIEVETLLPEAAAQFLLKRAAFIASDTSREQVSPIQHTLALEIAGELGCLPLALDQAGAYMEESQTNLNRYLRLYRQEQAALLEQRRGVISDHPESVVTTLSISFKVVEQINPVAADLLHLCAFLHSDAIPEELITVGAAHLGSLLQAAASSPLIFHEAIHILRNYSLIKRDADRNTLSIHRLVQVVLKHELDTKTYVQWAERAVRAVSEVFPEAEAALWARCERCLPHAQYCLQLIEEGHMEFPEAVRLLTRVGWYLKERAHYREAEPIVQRALSISTQQVESDHVDTAQMLNVLAGIYEAQGRYAEAEPLYLRALAIYEHLLGSEHPYTVRNLNNLASLYDVQGRYTQAEPLYQRALVAREQVLGPEHPDTAGSLNNLAYCYEDQGKYVEAEPLMKRALVIYEQQLGPDHPDTAASVNNLAELYCQQGKYVEAEPLMERALAIYEQQLGPDHPDTAASVNNLAGLFFQRGDYAKARSLYLRALAIYEQQLGPDHPDTANTLNNLAGLYCEQQEYAEAKSLLDRALKINEQQLGPDHPDTATSLHNLARLYDRQGQYAKAKPLYQRALAIREQQLGQAHPHTLITIEKYNDLLRKMGGEAGASQLESHSTPSPQAS